MKSVGVLAVLALRLFNRIFDWIEAGYRKHEQKKRQEKRDKAKDSPRDAFDLHFSGRMLADKADDAEATSKADTGNNGKPEG